MSFMSSPYGVYHGGRFEQLKYPTVGVKSGPRQRMGMPGLGASRRPERQGWGRG